MCEPRTRQSPNSMRISVPYTTCVAITSRSVLFIITVVTVIDLSHDVQSIIIVQNYIFYAFDARSRFSVCPLEETENYDVFVNNTPRVILLYMNTTVFILYVLCIMLYTFAKCYDVLKNGIGRFPAVDELFFRKMKNKKRLLYE